MASPDGPDHQMLGILEAQTPDAYDSAASAAPVGDSEMLKMLGSAPASPWEQYDAGAQNRAAPIDYGAADMAARGATLGLFDKGLALARSMRSGLPYATELSHLDLERQRYEEANPLTAGLSQFGGALLPMISGMGLVGRGVLAAGEALGANALLRGGARVAAEGATVGGMDHATNEEPGSTLGGDIRRGAEAGLMFGPLGGALAAPLRSNVSPEMAQLAQKFQDASGVKLYGSQLPGGPSAALKLAGNAPSGSQIDALTRAAARTAGLDTDTLLPETFRDANGALTQAGAQLENAALSSAGIPARDPQLLGSFNDVLKQASREFGGTQSDGYRRVLSLFEDIADAAKGGTISGKSYQNLTQRNSAIWNASARGSPVAPYASALKSALDDALQRSNPQQAQEILAGRHAYHNALILENSVDANGKIDPRALLRNVEGSRGYGSTFTASRKAAEAGPDSGLGDIGLLAQGSGSFLSGKSGGLPVYASHNPGGMIAGGLAAAAGAHEALPFAHMLPEHLLPLAAGAGALYAGAGALASRPGYAQMLLSGIDPSAALARSLVPAGNAYLKAAGQ